MSEIVLPLAIGAGAYYLLTADQRAMIDAQHPPTATKTALVMSPISGLAGKSKLPVSSATIAPSPLSSGGLISPFIARGGSSYTSQAELTAREKLREGEREAKKRYDAMASAAKKKGAAILNEKLHLSPPLEGDESWDDLGKRIGAAAGAAACVAAGAGVATPLCSIVGAYFGEKLGDFLEKHWADIKAKAKETYNDIKDKAVDLVGDAYAEVKDWF